jgi:hypothetical protein
MKTVLLAVCCSILLAPLLSAQGSAPKASRGNCKQRPELLYDAVVHEMWAKDEGDVGTAGGFIRIAVHPHWDAESFVDVRLNRNGPSQVTVYTLPRKTKYLVDLIRSAVKNQPCATARRIALKLPVKRETLTVSKELQSLIDSFMSLRLEPRPFGDSVRLDATEYDVEFCGEDTLRISTDDWESSVAKWVRDIRATITQK